MPFGVMATHRNDGTVGRTRARISAVPAPANAATACSRMGQDVLQLPRRHARVLVGTATPPALCTAVYVATHSMASSAGR